MIKIKKIISTELNQLEEIGKFLFKTIKTYHDWPKPGVDFKDIQSLLIEPKFSQQVATGLQIMLPRDEHNEFVFNKILAFDARGFIFGGNLAISNNIPLILARKPGKLPGELITQEFDKEYGKDSIGVQIGLIQPGDRILIHDDLLATGGTSAAAAKIITDLGAHIVGFHFIMELPALAGRKVLEQYVSKEQITSLISC